MYCSRYGLLALIIVVFAPSNGAYAEKDAPSRAVTKASAPAPAMPGKNVPAIKVNTVGYPTEWNKIAIFNVPPENAVVKDMDGETVMRIGASQIDERGIDPASKDPVWQVDFSGLKKPGRYFIEAKNAESDPFEIGDDVYRRAITAGLKSYYFQRTRTALEEPYAVWEGDSYTRRKPSHVHAGVGWDLEYYPEKKKRWALAGGWHDAGNFDIYIASAAPTAQAMLMAYEWAPGLFTDKMLNIPESGNGIPDILDEARWGLEWILSLQQDDGGFRHREAVMESTPEGPADEDKTVRWVAGVSSSATAKAVAALARASQVYARWDRDFAKRAAHAARKGWQWLAAHPEHVRVDGKGSSQPKWDDEPGFTDTGARFIAAVEMWRAFDDAAALAIARQLTVKTDADYLIGSWADLSHWAVAQLALDDRTPEVLKADARTHILQAVAPLKSRIRQRDGYRCATAPGEYYWGHNSNLMEKAHIMAVAAMLVPKEQWLVEAVRDQWHWILGRNPNGFSMVTRVGKGPARFYHMEWGSREPPPPGFLIGGPNNHSMPFLSPDAPAKALLWDNPKPLRSGLPAHSLWHWRESDLWDAGWLAENEWSNGWWTVVEPDIYYNANFILVAALLQRIGIGLNEVRVPDGNSESLKE